ncbi:adenosine deaminase [Salidesulfovibrio onnuriiensis]|uniref:adenosine deaminase n=1 Tax=Salidesulfovibrio onnuriiensis TaxID=2583823 RepID=UPI00164F4938|nr:adenosine deaminase [Salidesulfovibrio onnuriiensis]
MIRKQLRFLFVVLLLVAVAGCTAAKTRSTGTYFDQVREDPVRLRIFLTEMPKGGDIHNHLPGMVYAEDFLRMAAAKDMCLDPQNGYTASAGPCKDGQVKATDALRNAAHWNGAINAWSTRQDRRDSFMWGHDQFFATFFRFGAAANDMGYMLAEAAKQASHENMAYLELMLSVFPRDLWGLSAVAADPIAKGDLAGAYAALEQAGLFNETHLDECSRTLIEGEQRRDMLLKGGPGSEVHMRFMNHAIRTLPRHVVFAQLAYSFALAAQEPRMVGINLVAPEDDPVSMQDYELHMAMIDFLYTLYHTDPAKQPVAGNVNIALHAGELTLGLVKQDGLRNHIRLAIEQGHAQRIGHGIDISYEEDPYGLLRTMREKDIAIEIQLTSNDVILHVSGDRHPLCLYMSQGVPFALGSDDMGVARTDMTTEYLRAVQDQGLGYEDLKTSARNSLEYSFMPGSSLWADYGRKVVVPQCAQGKTDACTAFLSNNEKAAVQWRLERDLEAFEARW